MPIASRNRVFSNPALENTIHEILDLKRMRKELDAAITSLEDSVKAVMGDEELLIIPWQKPWISSEKPSATRPANPIPC